MVENLLHVLSLWQAKLLRDILTGGGTRETFVWISVLTLSISGKKLQCPQFLVHGADSVGFIPGHQVSSLSLTDLLSGETFV